MTQTPRSYVYIANWKMYFTFQEATAWVEQHGKQLEELAAQENAKIILAPSMSALQSITTHFQNTPINTAAQDCSDRTTGAFTGQNSARDIASIGATFCIIGHSERRTLQGDTDAAIAQKCSNLLQSGITPILCIGESAQDRASGQTLQVLQAQLSWVSSMPFISSTASIPLLIAYEPVWAIGTGQVPTLAELTTVFSWLKTIGLPSGTRLLYGGSVTSKTIASPKSCPLIDGFLIGGASLDFQEFKNLVHY